LIDVTLAVSHDGSGTIAVVPSSPSTIAAGASVVIVVTYTTASDTPDVTLTISATGELPDTSTVDSVGINATVEIDVGKFLPPPPPE
jgi:hypothetical protein